MKQFGQMDDYDDIGEDLDQYNTDSQVDKVTLRDTASAPTMTKDTAEETPPSTTLDGYTAIQQENSRGTRSEELEIMKQARINNRLSTSQIDESKIGVKKMPEIMEKEDDISKDKDDISKIYSQIQENK